MTDPRDLFLVLAIGAVVLLLFVIATSIIVPDPSHPAFAQSSGPDFKPLAFIIGALGVLGYIGKSIWDSHTGPSTNR